MIVKRIKELNSDSKGEEPALAENGVKPVPEEKPVLEEKPVVV